MMSYVAGIANGMAWDVSLDYIDPPLVASHVPPITSLSSPILDFGEVLNLHLSTNLINIVKLDLHVDGSDAEKDKTEEESLQSSQDGKESIDSCEELNFCDSKGHNIAYENGEHIAVAGKDTEVSNQAFKNFAVASEISESVDASHMDANSSEQSWMLRSVSDSSVACVTGDFAMQNVLLHMGFEFDVILLTGLLDFYGKEGNLGCTRKVFDEMTERSSVYFKGDMVEAKRLVNPPWWIPWSVYLTGYFLRGMENEAMDCSEEAVGKNSRVKMSAIAFNSVLDALNFFDMMQNKLRMDDDSYKFIMNALLDVGKPDEVLGIIVRMLREDPSDFTDQLQEFVREALRIYDQESIVDYLTSELEQIEVISILHVPATGKTSPAEEIYNDLNVIDRLHVCGQCMISQSYEKDKRKILLDIRSSLMKGQKEYKLEGVVSEMSNRELYNSLSGFRCLIVVEDMWDIQALDVLRAILQKSSRWSKILLIARFAEVAFQVSFTNLSTILENLYFLRAFLEDPSQQLVTNGLLANLESMSNEVASIVSSFDVEKMDNDMAQEMNSRLGSLKYKIEQVKKEGKELYDQIQKLPRSNFPPTENVDFINYMVENLRELLKHKAASIGLLKHQIATVAELLPSLKDHCVMDIEELDEDEESSRT